MDPTCSLCRQTLHRRCVGTFAPKYLSGDQLKAKCGAPIRVEVLDRSTGLPVSGDQLADIHIEVPSSYMLTVTAEFPSLSPPRRALAACLSHWAESHMAVRPDMR